MSFDPNEPSDPNDVFEAEKQIASRSDGEHEFVAEPEVLDSTSEQHRWGELSSEELSSDELCSEEDLETSFLHPTSLVFTVIGQLRQNLIPAVIAVFSAASGSYTFVIIAGGFFVLSMVAATFRYFTLRYRIQDGELTVLSGLIFRKRRKVPTSKIQNIDLVQNVLHRILGVAEVRIETASGNEPEAILRVLSMRQIARLREKVSSAAEASGDPSTQSDASPNSANLLNPLGVGATETRSEEVLSIPTSWLMKAGLASNRGMVLVGFLVGLFYQNVPNEDQALKDLQDQLKGLQGFFPGMESGWQLWLLLGLAGVLLLFLVRLLGVGWFLLRFFNYRLTRIGADFKISCGMLTKVSATVPLKRIQFISIHRPLIMRWFGLASIRIETAGGAGNSEDATTSVSKRWFIPVVPERELPRLMQTIRPGLQWQEEAFPWKPLAPKAASRFVRLAILFSLLLVVVGFAASQPWGWAPGVLLCPPIVWYAIRRCQSNRFARIDEGVLYRSGVLTKKTSITFFEKIQGVSLSQSPFDRRWGMQTLTIDTAAAGPANHRISIRFLGEDFATSEYGQILRRSTGQGSTAIAASQHLET